MSATRIPTTTGTTAVKTKTFQRSITFNKAVTAAEASATSGVIIVSTATPTDDFVFVASMRRSNVNTAGLAYNYSPTSGALIIRNSTASLTSGDVITIIGSFLK